MAKWHWSVLRKEGGREGSLSQRSFWTDLWHLCRLTWCRRPLGWKAHVDRFTGASRFRQTVLEIWKSTKYLKPLTIWNRQTMCEDGKDRWDWGRSYLALRSDDAGRSEEESVVRLLVVQVGGIDDDLLETSVILADVDRCSRKEVAGLVPCQHQHHL